MVSQRQLTKLNENIDVEGQRTLISGATQGIGAGLALRFALGGASVWLIGRNEVKAEELIDKLKLASAEASRRREQNGNKSNGSAEPDHQFIKADLSDVDELKRLVQDVRKKAGDRGIDWLIECQGQLLRWKTFEVE